ncbi:MAG: polysaccharide deacetylase family protein [Hyphomicrobiales bacterium]|nr:polysaccharide deacetylase family protein [Hyphomicrobiales bacterium]
MRYTLIRLALRTMALSGLDRLATPLAAGRGVILTFHHVAPLALARFPENAGLRISPAFLETILGLLARLGYELVPLDALPARLAGAGPRVAALTFDDGYRDNLDHALPVLARHGAPFTLFACAGFAERTAPLWWLDLEEAVLRLDRVVLDLPEGGLILAARGELEKRHAFRAAYWRLRRCPEPVLRAAISGLCRAAGIDQMARVERLCLDWAGLRRLAGAPGATIGAHSLSHPRLAWLPEAEARAEILGSRDRIRAELGLEPRHFAYPVGDPASAGAREYRLVAEAGFAGGVTTIPGTLRRSHSARPFALPRISVNGLFQREAALRTLLSGLPFAFSRGAAPSSG